MSMDLFAMFDMSAEVEEVKVEVKKAATKVAEKVAKKKAAPEKSTKVAKPAQTTDCLDGIDVHTVVRHPAFADIPLTEWFTEEEITQGIAVHEGDSIDVKKLTFEDIRVKLEERHPSFVKDLTKWAFDKDTNSLHPIIQAGKKGGAIKDCPFSFETLLPGGKIHRGLLMDFIAVAQRISDLHQCEIHADIYWTGTSYIMDFPEQVIDKEWVLPETNVNLQMQYQKIMEIHSHHDMPAVPSSTDNESERAFLLYCIVGKINKLFPDVFVRTCYKGRHTKISSTLVFDNKYLINDISAYSLSGVKRYEEIKKKENV